MAVIMLAAMLKSSTIHVVATLLIRVVKIIKMLSPLNKIRRGFPRPNRHYLQALAAFAIASA